MTAFSVQRSRRIATDAATPGNLADRWTGSISIFLWANAFANAAVAVLSRYPTQASQPADRGVRWNPPT
jgi:hypothetical protein